MISSWILINAQRRMLDALTAAGQLVFFDAIYLFAVPERTTQSKQNIVTNLYNATELGVPNFRTGYGYYGDGISDVGLSLINPATVGLNYTQNDAHISLFNRTLLSQGIELGQSDGVKGAWIASKYSNGNTFLNINGAAGVSFGNLTETRGWFYGERSGAANISLYRDGVLVNTLAQASVGIANQPFYALALNSSGAFLATSQSSKKLSLVTVGKSGINIAIVKNIINQFFINIGYPLRTVYGFGDSLMVGTNTTTQDFSFFNVWCFNKHYDWVNNGVGGQAIAPGGTQAGFNLANIPTKLLNYDYKVQVNWGLNDTVNFADGSRTLAQIQAGVDAFFTAFSATGWSLTNDLIWITDFQIQDNIWYTIAQYQQVTAVIKARCIANGVPYLSITNAPPYTTSDGVHPTNNAQYKIIADYIIENTGV